MATASTSAARIPAAMPASAASSSGTISCPVASIRPATVKQSSRGTSGAGRTTSMSNRLGRLCRPISIRSRNPLLHSSAVFAPVRWITALVVVVMPCPT